MKPTIRNDNSTYRWLQQDSWRYDYALHLNDRKIGSLKATSWTHQEYEGSIDDSRWIFRQEGFWRREVLCEEGSTRARILTFKPNWSVSEGKIEFVDGRTFEWSTSGFLRQVSSVLDYKGRKILEINEDNDLKPKGLKGWMRVGGSIETTDVSMDRKSLLILCFLALYLVLCRRDETSSAAAVAVMG